MVDGVRVEDLIGHLSPRTAAAYAADFRAIARALDAAPDQVLGRLLRDQRTTAELFWQVAALGRDAWAPATLHRRIACLRALCARALDAGIVSWAPPSVKLPDRPRFRTKSPVTLIELRRLLHTAERALRPDHAARLVAAVRLGFDVGLRGSEIVGLRLGDLDRTGGWLVATRKGGERQRLAIPSPTTAALDAWCSLRPSPASDAVFVALDGPRVGEPWGARSMRAQLAAFSRRVLGRSISPHDLRHAGVTAALDASGGDARRVARWANHRDVRVTLAYDDDRTDNSRELAELVAAQVYVPPRQVVLQVADHGAPVSPQKEISSDGSTD